MGGNLPIDGALFLEFLPGDWQWLLTFLSVWWAFGQLLVTLLAWGLINNYSCTSAYNCPDSSNLGWRYLYYVIGGIALLMAAARVVFMELNESPKFLLSQGLDEEVVKLVQHIAKTNGKESTLSVEAFKAEEDQDTEAEISNNTTSDVLNRQTWLKKYSLQHVTPL